MGISPDRAEEITHGGIAQFFEVNAAFGGVGEGEVGAAGAGEFGINIEAVADIDDDQKRRAAFGAGEGADVVERLVVGAVEGFVPTLGAAFAVAKFVALAGGTLFCFEDEVVFFVEVEVDRGVAAVFVWTGEGAVGDVLVFAILVFGDVGAGDFKEVAEFGEEESVVGALGTAGLGPAGDEGFEILRHDSLRSFYRVAWGWQDGIRGEFFVAN